MAAAASYAENNKCDYSRPSNPKHPSTGRIGSLQQPLAPLPERTVEGDNAAQMSTEDLYMSRFRPIANDNAASAGADSGALVLTPLYPAVAGADSAQSEVRVFKGLCREVLKVL